MNLRSMLAAVGLCSGLVAAGPASAFTECKADKDCKTTEACLGGACVDKSRLCKTDADCKGWQSCKPGCPPVAISVDGGSGSSGGGSTGCASSDGDACSDPVPPQADRVGGR